MLCPNCGNEVSVNNSTCLYCEAVTPGEMVPSNNTGNLVGFSDKINDPAFTSYKKKSVAWSFIFAAILAAVAMTGFPIYGNISGEIDWPYSFLYGLCIGCMFLVIAFMQTLKKGLDKTWDGTVDYKNAYRLKERNRNGAYHHHMVYILKVKKDSGRTKKHKWRDIPGPYNYYNIGDRVRHHKGFYYYEKYDKSKDSQIMCTACMSFHDIHKDLCTKCKCPLLK